MSPANDTLERPTVRIVATSSGSTYSVQGRVVHKLNDDGTTTEFELISEGERLRYTDGAQLYLSSPIVPSA